MSVTVTPSAVRGSLRGEIVIWFQADNGKAGEYRLWDKTFRISGGHYYTVYYWEALGNGGSAPSAQEATEAARRWIRDGK